MTLTKYTSVNAVASGLGLTLDADSTPTYDAVDGIIERISRLIDREHDDIPFSEETETDEYHDTVDGIYYFVLKKRPVTSIISVAIYDGATFVSYTEDTDRSHYSNIKYYYLENPKSGIVRATSLQGVGKDYAKISYKYGYTSVPAWVEELCIKMVYLDVLRAKMASSNQECEAVLKAWGIQMRYWRQEIEDIMNKYIRLYKRQKPFTLGRAKWS